MAEVKHNKSFDKAVNKTKLSCLFKSGATVATTMKRGFKKRKMRTLSDMGTAEKVAFQARKRYDKITGSRLKKKTTASKPLEAPRISQTSSPLKNLVEFQVNKDNFTVKVGSRLFRNTDVPAILEGGGNAVISVYPDEARMYGLDKVMVKGQERIGKVAKFKKSGLFSFLQLVPKVPLPAIRTLKPLIRVNGVKKVTKTVRIKPRPYLKQALTNATPTLEKIASRMRV